MIRIDNVLDGWGLSARVNWLVVNDKAGVGNGGQFAIGPSDSNIKQAWVDFPPTMHFDSAPQVRDPPAPHQRLSESFLPNLTTCLSFSAYMHTML